MSPEPKRTSLWSHAHHLSDVTSNTLFGILDTIKYELNINFKQSLVGSRVKPFSLHTASLSQQIRHNGQKMMKSLTHVELLTWIFSVVQERELNTSESLRCTPCARPPPCCVCGSDVRTSRLTLSLWVISPRPRSVRYRFLHCDWLNSVMRKTLPARMLVASQMENQWTTEHVEQAADRLTVVF